MSRVATVLVLVAAVTAGIALVTTASEPAPKKVPLVINMTAGTEDLHSFWMGLQLAGHALADGRKATIYMNVEAPVLASKKPVELVMDPRLEGLPKPGEQIAELLKKGAKIIVCPGCMKVQGLTKEDLLPGLELGTKEALFGPLDEGGAVFSY